MEPPEVHSELTSYGDNGLLALRPGSSGSFCQDEEPLVHRVIARLKTHHAPCQFDQSAPQPAISMLCDRTGHPLCPRAMFAIYAVREDSSCSIARAYLVEQRKISPVSGQRAS
jgi:hypothetical protein